MGQYLEIKNLTLGIRGDHQKLLVNNVSFSVQKGETVGIVGESGSGKTLTAMSILGLLPSAIEIKSGEINLENKNARLNLLSAGEKELREIRGKSVSVIFQEPLSSLNPSMRCGKQTAEIIKEHTRLSSGAIKNKVLEIFNEVGLPDPLKAYKSYPFQLSGGQQQRIMIAMAIANNPDYVIADEPTTALDVLVQKKIIDLLHSMQKKYGMGIIFISHDIDLVAAICDKMVVMRNGEIVEQGQKNEIIHFPKTSYLKGLILCKPRPGTSKSRLSTVDSQDNDSNEIIFNKPDYTKTPLLIFKEVNIHYKSGKKLFSNKLPGFHAVKNVSFEIFEGETLGLLGGSGSGKSTIGKAVVRLIENSSGEITYRGQNISTVFKEFTDFRKRIQMVFQDPYSSLNPKQRIGEALFEVLRFHQLCSNKTEGIRQVSELLSDVKLSSDFYYRYPHELSGGQRQRIVIARALALNPEFIICDESVSALDVSVQAEILNLLNEIKYNRKLTLLFISHDLSVVKYMSDRIIVINEGMIQEINTSDKLFQSPKSEYSKQLIDAMIINENY